MKNSKRNKKIIGIILILILAFMTNVYAANDSFKTNLTVDNSKVKKGQNVTVTISLSDIAIESGEKGIAAYTAKIDFDSSVLEYVSTKGTDKWEEPFYQDTLITGETKDAEVIKTSQSIGTITFKVKEDAKLGDTTIKLTNFSGSTASSDVAANDSSVKVTIINQNNGNGNANVSGSESGSENSNGAENEVVNGSENESSNGTENGNSQNQQNDTSKLNVNSTNKENIKQGAFPKTGYTNIALITLIAVATLVTIILFVRIILLTKKN